MFFIGMIFLPLWVTMMSSIVFVFEISKDVYSDFNNNGKINDVDLLSQLVIAIAIFIFSIKLLRFYGKRYFPKKIN